MASVPINSILLEIKNSYKPLFLISAGVIALQIGLILRPEFFESNLIPHFLIIIFPLGVSVYSFAISKIYGGSKVFGRSYFALGLGYFATFLTETLYVYFYDISGQDVPVIADYFLISFYLLVLIHLIVNIRYFAERLETFQKATIVLVPVIFVLIYSLLVFSNPLDDTSYFYYSLIFVFLSSLTMGFVIVGFSLFRQTVLFSAWLLLLVGISVGTIGDLVYHYVQILDGSWVDNVTSLWIASNMIMIYALYKHQKSI